MKSSGVAEAIARNAQLRREGTANLVRAAAASGVRRIIVQSIAWAYASAEQQYAETDVLDTSAEGLRRTTVAGVVELEAAVLENDSFAGYVLRYGQIYGGDSGVSFPTGSCPVHVDAAAYAALLAVTRGTPGAYNIEDLGTSVTIQKAIDLLGWDLAFRYFGPESAPREAS